MGDNLSMKKKLIMQSFAPLFLILFIKYFDFKLLQLLITFIKVCRISPGKAIIGATQHSLFATCILEGICLLWVVISLWGIRAFSVLQTANFTSQGEALIDIEKIPDSGVTFFMTYVLPMAMDDLDTIKGLIVFVILMGMLFILMWRTNLYYQNPVLTILGYEVFSFQFNTTQLEGFRNKECIGITRGTVRERQSIKRQKISDNVFLVYENI